MAVKDGDLDKFKSLLQNKSLLTQPDRTGLLPLHKAVILGQTDMIEYLGIKHDDILNLQDNVRIYSTSLYPRFEKVGGILVYICPSFHPSFRPSILP